MRTELGDSQTDALKQLEEHDRFLLVSDTLTSVRFLDEFSKIPKSHEIEKKCN